MKPWPIARSSSSEALVPFIFQLPATSGRIPGVIGIVPPRSNAVGRVHYQNRATKQSTVARKGAIALDYDIRRGATMLTRAIGTDMLDALRNAAGTWVAKLLLFLLVVSFAVWGISGQHDRRLRQQSHVITAGGTTVSPNDYRLAYDRQMQLLSQQFGTRLTREQATGARHRRPGAGAAGGRRSARRAGAQARARPFQGQAGAARRAKTRPSRGPTASSTASSSSYVLRQIGMRPEDYLRNTRAGRGPPADRRGGVRRAEGARHLPARRWRSIAARTAPSTTSSLPRSLVEPIEEPADAVLKTWFDEQQGNATPRPNTARSPMSSSSRKTSPTMPRDQRRAGARRTTTRTSRPLYDAGNAHDRAAHVHDARKRPRPRYRFDRAGADLRRPSSRRKARPRPTCSSAPSPRTRCRTRRSPKPRSRLQANEVSDVVKGAFGPVLVRVTEIKPEVVKPLTECRRRDPQGSGAWPKQTASCSTCTIPTKTPRAGGASLARGRRQAEPQGRDRRRDRPHRHSAPTARSSTTCRSRPSLLKQAFEAEAGIENPADQRRHAPALSSTRSRASRRRATARWTRCTPRSSPTGSRRKPKSGSTPRRAELRSG